MFMSAYLKQECCFCKSMSFFLKITRSNVVVSEVFPFPSRRADYLYPNSWKCSVLFLRLNACSTWNSKDTLQKLVAGIRLQAEIIGKAGFCTRKTVKHYCDFDSMEAVESLEDGECFKAGLDQSTKAVVRLEDGFVPKELESGVSFQVKDKIGPNGDDENSQPFFDSEELFQQLNYECIDGKTDSDSDTNEEESPFTILKKKMTAITDDKGVYKSLVKKGTGQLVTPGAICRVHYNGYVEYRDEPFDSTRLRNNQTQLKLGECFIRGLDVALATMRKGEISKFIFSPEYAFRAMGCPPRIPPNADVMFEVELVSFVDQAASDEFAEFSTEEQNKASFQSILKVTESFKETGNDLFKQSNFFQAIKKYDKGIHLLENCRLQDESEEKIMNNALLVLYLNSSLCALKLGQGVRAKKYGKKALELDPKNIKAIFRVANGFQKEGDFAKARDWYLRAQRQEPNNPDIRAALLKLDQEVQRWKISEKQMCERMFSHPKQDSPGNFQENEKPTVKASQSISEEVKLLMMKRLEDFQKDENQKEIVFPSSLTSKEVDYLVEEAKAKKLHAIPPSKKNASLKIVKEKNW